VIAGSAFGAGEHIAITLGVLQPSTRGWIKKTPPVASCAPLHTKTQFLLFDSAPTFDLHFPNLCPVVEPSIQSLIGYEPFSIAWPILFFGRLGNSDRSMRLQAARRLDALLFFFNGGSS
jgi:hypothetical protein